MSRNLTLQRVAHVLLCTALMPMMLSCSGSKHSDASKAGELEKPVPEDPNAFQNAKIIADSTEAIRLNSKEIDSRGELSYSKRGRAYAAKGEHDKAIADFAEAIRLYPVLKGAYFTPRLMEAYSARAHSFTEKRDYDAAIADYTEIIKLCQGAFNDPAEALGYGGFAAQAHLKRGMCYDEKGDRKKAMTDFTEAIRLAPDLKNDEDLKRRMSKS